MVHHTSLIVVSFVLLLLIPRSYSSVSIRQSFSSPKSDVDLVEFLQNLAFEDAEFFLIGTTGRGLDYFAPDLVQGGPSPIGGRSANLDLLTRNVSYQFGLVAVDHLRAIKRQVKVSPATARPLLNISREVFAQTVNDAFGRTLSPPFDPYANTLNYRLASYILSLVAPTRYAGFIRTIQKPEYKELVAGLLGAASGVHSIIRSALYEVRNLPVLPYTFTVAEFTNRIAEQANKLGKEGTKSEGILVPPSEGAGGKVSGNVIEGDKLSLTYRRNPEEVLRIIYGTGDERDPGGLFPKGANGRIAKYYLKE